MIEKERKNLMLEKRNEKIIIGFEKLGIKIIKRIREGMVIGRRIIIGVMKIDFRIIKERKGRILNGEKELIRIKEKLKNKLRIVIIGGNEENDILVEEIRGIVWLDSSLKEVIILVKVKEEEMIDGIMKWRNWSYK